MNLGAQHLLEPLVKEVYELDQKQYLFKLKSTGAFASKNLKEYQLGAAVRGRRKEEEEKGRFPPEFWVGKV
jgi:hypothetical protein